MSPYYRDPAYNYPEYVADGPPCSHCGNPTIPPTPGRPEEEGFYCEHCGTCWTDTGAES